MKTNLTPQQKFEDRIKANADHLKERLDEIIKDGLLKSMLAHMDTRLSVMMDDVVRRTLQQNFPQNF